MSIPKFYMRNVKSQPQYQLVIIRIIHPMSNTKRFVILIKRLLKVLSLLININCQKRLLICICLMNTPYIFLLSFSLCVPQVKRRLKEQDISAAISSETTVRYQFSPSYQYSKNYHTAKRYTGRFDVISRIQRGQVRKYHQDAHYVNAYFL